MPDLLQHIVLLPIGLKIVCASLGILLIHALFRLLETATTSRMFLFK